MSLTREKDKTIDLFADRCPDDTYEIHDNNYVCMSALVNSYNFVPSAHSTTLHQQREQVEFYVNDVNSFDINLIGMPHYLTRAQENIFVAACATEAIIKNLHKSECVGKEIVFFQAKYINPESGQLEFSPMLPFNLNENNTLSAFKVDFRTIPQGIVRNTYGHLNEGKIYVLLNHCTQEQKNKIKTVLSGLFPLNQNKLPEIDTNKLRPQR